MRIMITGALGFLGTELTNNFIANDIYVTAVVRKHSNSFTSKDFVKVVVADLRDKDSLTVALNGVDVVVHCAAAMNGDYHFQYENTVLATHYLISSMEKSGVKRLILISSYSVYDYQAISQYCKITEDSKLKDPVSTLGNYAKTKLIQEKCLKQSSLDYTILRLGVIVGENLPWISQIGIKLGKTLVLLGKNGEIPLISLSNCPAIISETINSSVTIGKTYNLVDDYLLTRIDYAKLLTAKRYGEYTLLSLPYKPVLLFVLLIQPVIYGVRLLKLSTPQIFNLESFSERIKPLKHSNHLFKKDTGWSPVNTIKAL